MSRNLDTLFDEKRQSNSSKENNGDETILFGKRSSSLAASINLFFAESAQKPVFDDGDRDYDEAWPRSPLLNCARTTPGPIYNLMTSKVATLRGGLHTDRRIKRRSSDENPLLTRKEEEPMYMDPSTIASRPRSTFYTETYLQSLKTGEGPMYYEASSGNGSIASGLEKKSRSQLPRNALLQYFGKTELKPEEVPGLDLNRAVRELTSPTHFGGKYLSGARRTTFVLIRILNDELIIEARMGSSEENLKAAAKDGGKIRKRFSFDKKKNGKSSNGIFRKKSSPSLSANARETSRKKSVVDLSEVTAEVGVYGEIGGDLGEDDQEKREVKRNGICMDIFLCMGCKNGYRSHDSAFESEEEPSQITKTATLSSPVNGNKVITSFELERIVYCGAEHTENSSVFLLVWLYHAAGPNKHTIECHAAACDDLNHAKSLATSLGEAIKQTIQGY